MSKIGKFFANILIIAYVIVAVSVTILLLSYNEYHCSVVGDYTFVLITDDELEEYGYNEGSLVLVKETKAKKINQGDHIFLYRRITSSEFEIKYAEVILKDESGGEYDVSYVLEGGTVVEHEDVIGSTEDIKVIPHLGTVLSILESRYGYLFLIVVVSFIFFLYEIYELIMEIKYGEREEEEEDYEEDEDDEYYDEDEDEEEEEVVVVKPKKATASKKVVASKTEPAKKVAEAKVATKKPATTKSTKTAKEPAKVTTKATTSKASASKASTSKVAESKVATKKSATSKTATKTSTAKKSGTAKKADTAKSSK